MKKNKINGSVSITATNERLLSAAKMGNEQLLLKYENSMSGFNHDDVEKMREKYGSNQITRQKKDSLIKRLVEAFVNPFTVVLFVLAMISLITDVVIASPGQRDFTSVIIVMTMVMVSGTLRFVQETRSNKSAEKLSEMVKTTTAVQRKPYGKAEIPLDEVVVGDIVYLAAGDMVPADVRILQAKDLFIGQSSLTGESEPVEKTGEKSNGENIAVLELSNCAFMGSNVVSGSAICMVIAVGDDTVFGAMAKTITGKKVETSFEKGVNSVSWLLVRFMLCMTPVVLFVNGFTKGDWLQAFLFALSVAVGLTPEMLPMIVTTNLAKGAVNMAKKKTVVKNLNAIQNFGAMDVLCTDKTGTLTRDKVVLEQHLDIHGMTKGFFATRFLTAFTKQG